MSKRLNISSALPSVWSDIVETVRSHPLWKLPVNLQPIIHMRGKKGGGASFSIDTRTYTGEDFYRSYSSPGSIINERLDKDRITALLDRCHEVMLLAISINDEVHACGEDIDVSFDTVEISGNWAYMVPPVLRNMFESGMIDELTKDHNGYLCFHRETEPQFKVTVEIEEPNHLGLRIISKMIIENEKYYFFFGKSVSYIRVYGLELPHSTLDAIQRLPLDQLVDETLFHHPYYNVEQTDKNGRDLVIYLTTGRIPLMTPPIDEKRPHAVQEWAWSGFDDNFKPDGVVSIDEHDNDVIEGDVIVSDDDQRVTITAVGVEMTGLPETTLDSLIGVRFGDIFEVPSCGRHSSDERLRNCNITGIEKSETKKNTAVLILGDRP